MRNVWHVLPWKEKMKTIDKSAHLYWVITPDHEEDWFVFACNKKSAECFREQYEANTRTGTTATLIIENVPQDTSFLSELPRHAEIADLKLLGFEIIVGSRRRAVKLDNLLFIEGGLQSLINRSRDCKGHAADSVHI
jgi:hypothetical protein